MCWRSHARTAPARRHRAAGRAWRPPRHVSVWPWRYNSNNIHARLYAGGGSSPGRPVLFVAVETRMDRTGLRRRLARRARPVRALRGIGAAGALLLAGAMASLAGCSEAKAAAEPPPRP